MSLYDKVFHIDDFHGHGGTFTNGCFDIIHKGHIKLFEFCHSVSRSNVNNYCCPVVVGVNTDSSIKELKGNDRPIMDQDNRVAILGAIRWIDYIVLFDTKSVLPVIEKIKPQILVKGGNYSKKSCAEADRIVGEEYIESYGGKVLTGPMLEGISSTKIIDKIRKV